MTRPLAIDLFCGVGGWSIELIAAGWYAVGFDIEQHVYGEHRYPGQLVIQDVRTLHGSQFKTASLIVASPPCTRYSYMAMPFSRGKQIAAALRGQGEFPAGYLGPRTIAELNELFDACFRIQHEACEAAGRHIPMVVENVKGAQPWVGRARWVYGSYLLWGDVPALMPYSRGDGLKAKGCRQKTEFGRTGFGPGSPWRDHFKSKTVDRHVKQGGDWFAEARSGGVGGTMASFSSKSPVRKMASALIAKIPPTLARHVARTFLP